VGELQVEVFKGRNVPVAPLFIRQVIGRAAQVPEVAARLPEGSSTLAVRLTSDREMERLNRRYAGDPHSTDVLSFAGEGAHAGDVAVSWQAVVRQATQYGHSELVEVALLSVHGLLHVLGWDHATDAEHAEMTRLTTEALALSGLEVAPGRL
jgi:probable rRNA maturation factor